MASSLGQGLFSSFVLCLAWCGSWIMPEIPGDCCSRDNKKQYTSLKWIMVAPSHTAVRLGSAGQICASTVQWPVLLLFWLSKPENTMELIMIFSFPHAEKSRGCREMAQVHMSFWEQGNTGQRSTFWDCKQANSSLQHILPQTASFFRKSNELLH